MPDLFRLVRKIVPTFELDGVIAIDDTLLERYGIRGLIWDVDGTLTAHHAAELDPDIHASFEILRARSDLRHAIVSNCPIPRFRELGDIFSDMPVLLGFETAEGPAYRILEAGEEKFEGPGRERLAAGERDMRPLRKPSGALVLAALRAMGLEGAPEAVLMVGDQYFTDIASANLAGVRSAKVPTLRPHSFPFVVRFGQGFERVLYRLLHGKRR